MPTSRLATRRLPTASFDAGTVAAARIGSSQIGVGAAWLDGIWWRRFVVLAEPRGHRYLGLGRLMSRASTASVGIFRTIAQPASARRRLSAAMYRRSMLRRGSLDMQFTIDDLEPIGAEVKARQLRNRRTTPWRSSQAACSVASPTAVSASGGATTPTSTELRSRTLPRLPNCVDDAEHREARDVPIVGRTLTCLVLVVLLPGLQCG